MSHVATVNVEIKSLDDLEEACRRIGLELVRGHTKFRVFNGSYRPCNHMIRIPLDHPYQQQVRHLPYEIGVLAREDGQRGFELSWDPFCGGFGLAEFVCDQNVNFNDRAAMPKLKQAYALVAAKNAAMKKGFRVTEKQSADGSVQLVMTR